jgi:hypothetical protein
MTMTSLLILMPSFSLPHYPLSYVEYKPMKIVKCPVIENAYVFLLPEGPGTALNLWHVLSGNATHL